MTNLQIARSGTDLQIQMGSSLFCEGLASSQALCCPLYIAPDPDLCSWNIGMLIQCLLTYSDLTVTGIGAATVGACHG